MTNTHYGLDIIELESGEYAIGKNEEEIKQAVTEYCQDTLRAFNPEFIISHLSSDLDGDSMIEMIRTLQQTHENSNGVLLKLINDFDHFVDDAIKADGEGHFLSSYDGEQKSFSELDLEDRRQLKRKFDKKEVVNYTFFRIN